jgi:hypothetical protein
MFGLGHVRAGGGHVQEIPLESGPEAGYVWLTQKMAERPDMSGLGGGHVQKSLLESGVEARHIR